MHLTYIYRYLFAMNRNLLLVRTLYTSTSGKYIKLKIRLDKAIQSGRFYTFSKQKQHSLLARLRKLFEKVKAYHTQLKLTGVGAAIALALSANPAQAQSTLGPFVQADNKNPLPPPYRIVKPRPAPVDIDNDGDLDVFVGDKYGNIHFFRNNAGEGNVRRFENMLADDNPAAEILIYGGDASPAFIDIDGDGDYDLLIGSALGNTHFFRNTGSRTAPVFTPVLDSTNPFNDVSGLTKYSSFGPANPTFVDLDKDTDLDLVIGSSTVSYGGFSIPSPIKYYENNNGTFTLVSNHPLFNNITYKNEVTTLFTDIDGDGDLDMFAGMSGHMETFINDGTNLYQQSGQWDSGTKTGNAFNNIFYGIYGRVAPAFVDLDDDGDLDFLIGRGGYQPLQYSDPILYVVNDGEFNLEVVEGLNTSPFDGVDVNQMARVTFADLDGDLDLDAIIGSKYQSDLIVYTNTDGDFIQDFSHPLTEFNLDFQSLPTFVDIDGDGDQDLFVGTYDPFSYSPRPFFFIRNSDGTFDEQEESPLPASLSFAFLDIDNDGDLDVFTTEDSSSPIRFYENTGSVTNPIFVPGTVPAPFDDLTSKYGSYVTATDFDHDGDIDMVVSVNNRLSDYIKTKFSFFENNGNETFTEIESPFDVMTTENDHISFADIDNDGDDDILLGFGADYYGGENGTFRYFENQNPQPVTSITTTTLTINGAEPVVLDPTLTIVDDDNDDIVLAAITIGDYIQGEEFLTFNTPPNGVTGLFDTQTGVLTFNGKATLAQYQALLRTVTYEFTGTLSTDAAPAQNGRKTDVAKTITFAVRDTDFTLTTVSIVNLNILSGPLGELRVFNAVSANGDALNSHFRIEGLATPNKVTIVNRWGDRVYEVSGYNSDDTSKRFEGKSDNGKDLPTGTYYYTIEVDGKKVTGFLSLKR
jgi:gliding motility-associated-like protein